jgi:predicted AlkP superfamily phosphohydrolase/phosphomutase
VAGKTRELSNPVIISIDALHPDALDLARIPTIRKLMADGACTADGRSTEPPKTLIARAAMFTGLSPGENGKRDNDWAAGESTVKKEAIFDIARRHGF